MKSIIRATGIQIEIDPMAIIQNRISTHIQYRMQMIINEPSRHKEHERVIDSLKDLNGLLVKHCRDLD